MNSIDTIKTDHLTQNEAADLIWRIAKEHQIIPALEYTSTIAEIIERQSEFEECEGFTKFTPAALNKLQEEDVHLTCRFDDYINDVMQDSLKEMATKLKLEMAVVGDQPGEDEPKVICFEESIEARDAVIEAFKSDITADCIAEVKEEYGIDLEPFAQLGLTNVREAIAIAD